MHLCNKNSGVTYPQVTENFPRIRRRFLKKIWKTLWWSFFVNFSQKWPYCKGILNVSAEMYVILASLLGTFTLILCGPNVVSLHQVICCPENPHQTLSTFSIGPFKYVKRLRNLEFSVRKITNIQGSVLSSCEGRAAFNKQLSSILLLKWAGKVSDWRRLWLVEVYFEIFPGITRNVQDDN